MKDVKIVIADGKVYELNENSECDRCIANGSLLCLKLNNDCGDGSTAFHNISDQTRVDLLELLNNLKKNERSNTTN